MILEAGLAKAIAAGGGLVSGVALIAGMAGGGQYAAAQADPAKQPSTACSYTSGSPRAAGTRKLDLPADRWANAKAIVETAQDLRLPKRAAVIGVATALQESALDNAVVGDHGRAFGIFQQHPEHGWGSRAEVTDPRHAAKAFFSRLVKVKDWDTKPLPLAAQAVQRSALPDAYAQHESRAERIVGAINGESAAKLSAEDDRSIRTSLDAAIALGVPRAAVVSDVAAGVRAGTLPSARKLLNEKDLEQEAEKLVESAAARLCTELTQNTGKALHRAVGDGSRGAIALDAALQMIGVPYSWGGGGPNGPSYGIGRGAHTKGFDCSGLAEYAWSKAGVRIGGHTSTQWRAGVRVRRSEMRPGDLVFFATNPRDPATIHHVAINIDGRRYVHAPRTGSLVQVSSWTSGREAQYAGAVRPG
ncbi:C40 family peptidase, partial [Nonomuraea sp. RK-328]|nr:C40 family peptidase [Nonomuraea sp. RK-328]